MLIVSIYSAKNTVFYPYLFSRKSVTQSRLKSEAAAVMNTITVQQIFKGKEIKMNETKCLNSVKYITYFSMREDSR